jgi:1,4-alpha-glucan branching enzyme
VVHGKGSLIGKMPGDRWQRFANLRAYLGFMWTHPGKKLLFMGGEFAQEREWNHDRSLDWHLLDDPAHAGISRLIADLNRLYRSTPSLYERDCDPAGFQWIEGGDIDRNVFVYLRLGADPSSIAVVICNMSPMVWRDYRVGTPKGGAWREILNTDSEHYGGSNVGNAGKVTAEETPWHGQTNSLSLVIPPLATLVLAPEM